MLDVPGERIPPAVVEEIAAINGPSLRRRISGTRVREASLATATRTVPLGTTSSVPSPPPHRLGFADCLERDFFERAGIRRSKLDLSNLADLYRAAQESQAAYVAGLPEWVRVWMRWMGIVLPTCLLFAPFRAEARWVLAALLASQLATQAIGLSFGWNRLWGLAHLLFWTPAVILLWRRWPRLSFTLRVAGGVLPLTPIYRVWAGVTLGTMAISLGFDFVDVARYLTGDP